MEASLTEFRIVRSTISKELTAESWRFIAPIFLHVGVIHFLLNMFAQWIICGAVERMIGEAMDLMALMYRDGTLLDRVHRRRLLRLCVGWQLCACGYSYSRCERRYHGHGMLSDSRQR